MCCLDKDLSHSFPAEGAVGKKVVIIGTSFIGNLLLGSKIQLLMVCPIS